MDALDRRLLDIIQTQFPVDPCPYAELGRQLGLAEAEVLRRVGHLKEQGVIRRMGAVLDSRKLGYSSTLCALKVPEDQVEQAAAVVNSFPGVTHNYLRDGGYNMWFTLIAPSRQEIEAILRAIKERTGLSDLLELPALELYKIRVNFSFAGEGNGDGI